MCYRLLLFICPNVKCIYLLYSGECVPHFFHSGKSDKLSTFFDISIAVEKGGRSENCDGETHKAIDSTIWLWKLNTDKVLVFGLL